MIFAIGKHVELIIKGDKTQTRRASDRYQVGQLYSIQPCRTCKGITNGKILIVKKTRERHSGLMTFAISREDAEAEGGYNPDEFEQLYEKIHPNWIFRYAYVFRFVPNSKRHKK